MNHAEQCPVCNGAGKLWVPPPKDTTSINDTYKPCHGCRGTGWVTVPNKPPEPIVGDYPSGGGVGAS